MREPQLHYLKPEPRLYRWLRQMQAWWVRMNCECAAQTHDEDAAYVPGGNPDHPEWGI